MHDGSILPFTRLPEDYKVNDRLAAVKYLQDNPGEIATGILYAEQGGPDVHEMNNTPPEALAKVPFEKLCPGSAVLSEMMESFR